MLLMCVNLWSVVGAAVAAMVIGFIWYAPLLFAKPWMLAMAYDPADKARTAEMQKSAGPKYAISFLCSLLSAFLLGKIISMASPSTARCMG
jgi:hypothetical protein